MLATPQRSTAYITSGAVLVNTFVTGTVNRDTSMNTAK